MSSSRRAELLRGVAALLLGLGMTAGLGFAGVSALDAIGAGSAAAREAIVAAAVTLVLLLVGRTVERLPPAELGLAPAHVARDLVRGTLLGALLISAVVGVLAAAGAYVVVDVHFPAVELVRMVVVMALVAWFEELLFRGILFRILARHAGRVVALVVSAALFGAVHLMNPGSTAIAAVAIAVEAGVLLGAAYLWSGALWLPIGMHFAWNLFQGSVYGAPVSGTHAPSILVAELHGPTWLDGGAFGPEAGAAAVVFCTLLAALLLRAVWRRDRRVLRAETPPKPEART